MTKVTLVHEHRFGDTVHNFEVDCTAKELADALTSGGNSPNEEDHKQAVEVANRLGLDYEPWREDEFITVDEYHEPEYVKVADLL